MADSIDSDADFSSKVYPITLRSRWDTTDDFTTIPYQIVLSLAALVVLAKFVPVHSLILSSHRFFCLSFSFTVSCRIVFAKSEHLELWPKHHSFRFIPNGRSSSYFPMATWIFLRTVLLVTWSLYETSSNLRSIKSQRRVSFSPAIPSRSMTH